MSKPIFRLPYNAETRGRDSMLATLQLLKSVHTHEQRPEATRTETSVPATPAQKLTPSP